MPRPSQFAHFDTDSSQPGEEYGLSMKFLKTQWTSLLPETYLVSYMTIRHGLGIFIYENAQAKIEIPRPVRKYPGHLKFLILIQRQPTGGRQKRKMALA